MSFLTGVAAASTFGSQLPVVTWLCSLGAGLVLLSRVHYKSLSAAQVALAGVAVVCFSLGLLRFEIASWQFQKSSLEPNVGQDVTLSGQVIREPDIRDTATQLHVATRDDIVLVRTDTIADVSYGDIISVTGELKKPEPFTTDLGRTFDYPAYLLVKGIEYQISFADVTVESRNNGVWILEKLFSLKHTLMRGIESVLVEPYAGLGQGLLLGAKQAIGDDLEAAFRTSGIVHIVVLSGYNVMLVVTFVLFLLSFICKKQTRILFGIIAIVLFALLVGLSATVVRASIMAGLLLFADYLGRRYDLLRALVFAGTVMVLVNPYLLMYDIGFQLSFMATLGLILVVPLFESFATEGFSNIKGKDFLLSTIATQVAVLPLLIYHIGEVSLVAVVVNLLVLPVVPLAMLLTFVTGVMALILPAAAVFVGMVAHLVLWYVVEVAVFFAGLPIASLVVPEVPVLSVFLMYGGLGFGWYWLRSRTGTKDAFSDWIIEEEAEKTGATRGVAPASETPPVFFR
jgi:competence protein ComEC